MNKLPPHLTEEQKNLFAASYLLYLIVQESVVFSINLEQADKFLEPVLMYMYAKNYIQINKQNEYIVTKEGEKQLDVFTQQYEEYVRHFDIYSAVDLESGEFAFEKMYELDSKSWDILLQEERFSDLRITVALFKGINPANFVFLNFLQEERFNTNVPNWQFDLASGLMWQEIDDIIQSAITIQELEYREEDGTFISGEMVLRDILVQGARINMSLQAQETSLDQEDDYKNDFATPEEDSETVTTYVSYYDPLYVNPIWFLL